MAPQRLDAAIARALDQHGALDDDQLGAIIGTTRQSARSAALRMQEAGVVVRMKPPSGKWVTSLKDGSTPPTPTSRTRPLATAQSAVAFDPSTAIEALVTLHRFTRGEPARSRVTALERALTGATHGQVGQILEREMVTDGLLRAGLLMKALTGEINVIIHSVGILLALPYVLSPDEQVLNASLGAGTGGRSYDLETTHRVAEFKFTRWRGHDAVRQRELFADFVNLAENESGKLRELYVAGDLPRRFLETSRRQLVSVCERRPEVLKRITTIHGERFRTVREYTLERGHRVKIVDLETLLPAYIVVGLEAAGE